MLAPGPRAAGAGALLDRDRLTVAAAALAVLLAECVLALAIADARFRPLIVPFVAAGGMALTFRFPRLASYAFLALTVFLFHPEYFTFAAGPVNIRPHEVVLAALLLVALVRPARRTWGGVAGGALAAFCALLALAAVLSVAAGRSDLTSAFQWSRPFAVLAFFYVVVRLFPDRRSVERLLAVAAALAAGTGLVAVLVEINPALTQHFQDPGRQVFVTQRGLGTLERVRLPGVAAAYLLLWYSVVRALEGPGGRRLGWLAVVAGIVVNIALSFNRNMWIGVGFGLVLLLTVAGTAARARLAAGIAVATVGVTLMWLFGVGVGASSRLDPLVERGRTLVDPPAVAQEQSLVGRRRESRLAWDAARKNLLTGIGPGVPYGFYFNEERAGGRFQRVSQRFVHNQYLALMLIAGVPALGAFMLFLLATLRAAWRQASRDPTLTACGVGVAMLMLSALVMLAFSTENLLAALALVSGAITAARPRGDPEARRSR